MKHKIKNISKRKLLLLGTALLSICAVLFYILYCTKSMFTSDMAYWLLLADEQIKNHQFFPDDFCYTTGIITFSPELIVLILRLFCQNWLLCREFTVIFMTLALIVLIFCFYHHTLSGKSRYAASFFSIILLALPMKHYLETFYEAAYEYQLLWDLVLMIVLKQILFPQKPPKENRKISILYIVWFILLFLCNIKGIKSIFLFTLPLILTFPLFSFIESGFHFELIFKNKKHNILLLLSIIGALLGITAQTLLSKLLLLDSITGSASFAGTEKLAENLNNLIVNIIDFYSAAGEGDLLSLSGIVSCLYFVVMFVCTIISPIWMVFRHKKNKNPFWKFYTIYALISNFLLLYTMVFTTAIYPRYYELAFWHNLVFTSVFLTDVIKKKDKYYEGFIYTVTAIVFLLGHLSYITGTVLPIHNEYAIEQKEGSLIDFLKENDLDYGFAAFWNSYKYMALSNGEITIISYIITPTCPYYWMTSRSYYDVDEHPGKCFILVGADDEAIDEKYYLTASEVKEFQDYKILIYEKNIFLYEELISN